MAEAFLCTPDRTSQRTGGNQEPHYIHRLRLVQVMTFFQNLWQSFMNAHRGAVIGIHA